MKRLLCLLVVASVCGGCAANLGLQIGSTGKSATAPTVGPGGSFSSGGVGVLWSERASFGAILGAVGLGFLVGRGSRMDDSRIPPAVDANRAVNEQDCSQAVRDLGANLRCR